jgi:hypothetical protein
MHIRRKKISDLIWDFHHHQIAYGPFKGLKLTDNSHWGVADKGTMCLGIYEQEILQDLSKLSGQIDTFIDLGAADGYYGIGVVVGKIFKKSYCFEISEKGRETIDKNAKLKDVSSQIVIKGAADSLFYNDISEEDIKNSVLFVDVEGAEFDIFNDLTFKIFRNSIIYIELHDWFYEDGALKINKLIKDSSNTHNILEFKMGSRDLSQFQEISTLSDSDRWLICSEGRSKLMTWLKLTPKSKV